MADRTLPWTVDAEPTLTDDDIVAFCRDGFLLLRGVVPEAINRRTCDYLERKIPADPAFLPPGMTGADLERLRASHEPSAIFLESWFYEHVLLQPRLVGIMRSLLGPWFGLPVLASHHRVVCPAPAQEWHHDADRVFGPELHFVEVFYFPQDTPLELGPTEIAPRTQHGPHRWDADRSGVFADGPAGTLGIHHQSILHRRGKSSASGLRHMLKYNYWRTSPPARNWAIDPTFDLATADFGGHEEARFAAHQYFWMCGRAEEFRTIGGQGWPWRSPNQIGPSYGFGVAKGYRPDWRRKGPDGYSR